MTARSFRPRLRLPFTVFATGDAVHLIAGEDVRYTVRAGAAAVELAALLKQCDGSRDVSEILQIASGEHRDLLGQLLQRLAGERVLVAGPVELAAPVARFRPVMEGCGPLLARFASAPGDADPIAVLCQDDLDYEVARQFNRRCLQAGTGPWLWITTGAASRGYVSPVFLPNAGPCLECLLRCFRRLSPAPQLYDALRLHAQQGGAFVPTDFPEQGLTVLEQTARWKIDCLSMQPPPPAVFRLHVLELETMELHAHRVYADPTCPECANDRLA
jgi:bacteriocin biosynthesis cyclodehydratase domain-containing protein